MRFSAKMFIDFSQVKPQALSPDALEFWPECATVMPGIRFFSAGDGGLYTRGVIHEAFL